MADGTGKRTETSDKYGHGTPSPRENAKKSDASDKINTPPHAKKNDFRFATRGSELLYSPNNPSILKYLYLYMKYFVLRFKTKLL